MSQANLFNFSKEAPNHGQTAADRGEKSKTKPWIKKPGRLFDPSSNEPFKLSRTKIENFIKCPRCFYLDRRLGVAQPPGFPFSLNAAVDHLLKKEFDAHRAKGSQHPLMQQYQLDLIPFNHPKMDVWRENFKGVEFFHQPSNFTIFGAVDDLWVNSQGELSVVDYKATSKDTEVTLDADWQQSYKNQVEIYQWLLRRNDFLVSDTAYFVYVNGKRDRTAFDGRLEFDVKLIAYHGCDSWVEKTILEAKKCLLGDNLPEPAPDCEYCTYRQQANMAENKAKTVIS